MKKLVKLLAVMLIAIMAVTVLVACDDSKKDDGDKKDPVTDNGNSGDNGNKDDGNKGDENQGGSSVGNRFTVTFVVKNPDTGEDLMTPVNKQVAKNKSALPPKQSDIDKWIVDGWDCDGDGKADKLYEKVTGNMTVTAVLREKKQFTVSFVARDGATALGSVSVRENDQLGNAWMQSIDIPVIKGYYYTSLKSLTDGISVNVISGDCTFQLVYAMADGTVPKVDKIELDGKRDAAYETAVTLPVDYSKQSDWEFYNSYGQLGSRAEPQITANTKAEVVWDGDYVYLLISVDDKTLGGRTSLYMGNVDNAWMNDSVELFYSFEKGENREMNRTKVGVVPVPPSQSQMKYSVPLSSGINQGRSTHFEEIQVAVSTYMTDNTLSSNPTNGQYSYRVEIKIPAKTEGSAAENCDPSTGLKPSANEGSKDKNDYAFTDGEKLSAGDCIHLQLQINDLQADLRNDSNYREAESTDEQKGSHYIIYKEGNKDGAAAGTPVGNPPFSASGRGQYYLKYYINLVLNDKNEGETLAVGYDNDGNLVKADGTIFKNFNADGD